MRSTCGAAAQRHAGRACDSPRQPESLPVETVLITRDLGRGTELYSRCARSNEQLKCRYPAIPRRAHRKRSGCKSGVSRSVILRIRLRQLEADVRGRARAHASPRAAARAAGKRALAGCSVRSVQSDLRGALEAGSDPRGRTVAIVVPAGLPSTCCLRRPDLVQPSRRSSPRTPRRRRGARGLLSHAFAHRLSGQRERGAVRLVYRPAGYGRRARRQAKPSTRRAHRRTVAGCRCARAQALASTNSPSNAFERCATPSCRKPRRGSGLERERPRGGVRTTLRFARLATRTA